MICEEDGIWIYNCSGCDLFVNGLILIYFNEKCFGGKIRYNIFVYKVFFGYLFKVYDYNNFIGEVCCVVDSVGVRCYYFELV